jgi:cyanate lyase
MAAERLNVSSDLIWQITRMCGIHNKTTDRIPENQLVLYRLYEHLGTY